MELITNLAATSSKLDKLALLKMATYKEHKVLFYAYNSNYRYHIANLEIDFDNLGLPTDAMFGLLDDLRNRKIVGNEARDAIDLFAFSHGDLIKLVVNKDLRCGVATTLINDAIRVSPLVNIPPIPIFKVQLAAPAPKDLSSIGFPRIAQIKYDGVRATMLFKNGKAVFKTRNGKIINVPGLSSIIEGHEDLGDYVLDGELTLKTGKSIERTTISGMVNSALHGGILDFTKVVFNVFDRIHLSEFEVMQCKQPYMERYALSLRVVKIMNTDCIKSADWVVIDSAGEANDYYAEVLAEGYEGLILKTKDHKYAYKRNKSWIKVKAILDADLTVLETISGEGKYEGMIGALLCTGTVDGKTIYVNVGSGLSDAQRGMSPSEYKGKTIEMQYNDVIRNSRDDGWTLFLPRFICIREDK